MLSRALTLMGILVCNLPASVVACEASAMRFGDSFMSYGPGILAGITSLARCGSYRAFVVHANGTDMLFLDKLVPVGNGSALVAAEGMPIVEFNHYEASTEIRSLACQALGPEKLRVSGEAFSFHTDRAFRFVVSVDAGRGCYTYEDTQRQ